MANDTIAISNANKTENIALNGGQTVGSALAKFFNCEQRQVEGKLVGQMVRLNNTTVDVPADLNTPLRAGDFISMYPVEVARGGVKGACI